MKPTRDQVCQAIAKSLRDFGYPDCTSEMIGDVLDAWNEGKRDADLPHEIIGRFAHSQLEELQEGGVNLAALSEPSQ